MFEDIGVSEEELDELGKAMLDLGKEAIQADGNLKSEVDMYTAVAKLPIGISKIKKIFSRIRIDIVKNITIFLSEFLLKNLPNDNKEFIQQLNAGDDEAFKHIITLIKAEVSQHFPVKTEAQERVLAKFDLSTDKIISFFNKDVKNYLCRAAACILSDIPEAAEANLEMAILKTFEVLQLHQATDSILLKEGEIKRASEISKKGNKVKHAKSKLVKIYTINLYKNGKFSSMRNASQKLAPKIIDYAKSADELKHLEGADNKFTCPFQTATTIERWIREDKKQKIKDNV